MSVQDIPEEPSGWMEDAFSEPIEPVYSQFRGRKVRTKTVHNLFVDEVISALQKAVRRSQPLDAARWALELMDSNLSGRAWSRFMVMSVEDIGISDPLMCIKVRKLMEIKGIDEGRALATCAEILCSSPRTRINDWAVNMYGKGVESLVKKGGIATLDDAMWFTDTLRMALKEKKTDLSLVCCDALWFSNLDVSSLLSGTAKRPKNLVWKVFSEMESKFMELTMGARTKLSEGRLLYAHLIHLNELGLLENGAEMLSNDIEKKTRVSLTKNWKLFEDYYKTEKKGVPRYALDKHTARGRSGEENKIVFFVAVSGLLANEDPRYKRRSNEYLKQMLLGMGFDKTFVKKLVKVKLKREDMLSVRSQIEF